MNFGNVLNDDITCLIIEMLGLSDVTSTSHVCQSLRRLAKAVTERRFRRLLVPFGDEAWKDLVGVLRQSKGLITGSTARAMLSGEVGNSMRDLNLVVPHDGFKTLEDFVLDKLGYSCITSTCHPAMTTVTGHFRKYSLATKIITLACPARNQSVLHLILSAPTTADMIYMTTGGLTCFYPQWLEQRVAICTRAGNLVVWDNKLGCAGELHEDLRVEADMAFIGEPCGTQCPTLWHHVGDKRLRKSINWDITDSATNTCNNVDIEWRINTYCDNEACQYNSAIMAGNLEGVGANNRADIKFLPGEIQCRRPRFLQWFKGIFYGAACHRPFLVRVPVMDGIMRVPRLADLYVDYWVRQRDHDAVTCARRHLRKTFHSVPNSTMELEGTYTVFFEKGNGQSTTNRLLERMGRMTGKTSAVNGSILVVKQTLQPNEHIVDMTRDDMLITNFLISSALHHGSL
ncbi:hypothetical protein BD769DRAFT_1683037 [Suillus cothurnatus]|nr:hypothetical protein BD769DRAFT_1683037 [Suillus cothurnatus]